MTDLKLRLKGMPQGQSAGLQVSDGTNTASAATPTYRLPSPITGRPRISDGFDTDTLTLDTTGLTGISAYEWRIVGGAVQGTASTLPGTGLGDKWIECSVTANEGTFVSWPVMVYASMMMGMTMDPAHHADDRAIVALVPHAQVTHVAVADGNWTNPSTWFPAEVPSNGAFVLIPHGRAVVYDNQKARVRLDRIRVDGTLRVDAANLTNEAIKLLVETIVNTRGSTFEAGNAANRIPATASVDITFSGKDYCSNSYTPTSLAYERDSSIDPRLWGRGHINQGTRRIWGKELTTWMRAGHGLSAGDTQVSMESVPDGWTVGQKLVIGACDFAPGANQDETVTITAIDGLDITFTPALLHHHKNTLAASTRTDLYPVIMAKSGQNVTYRSEVTKIDALRGHTVDMHHCCTADIWGVAHIGLGRTAKGNGRPSAVIGGAKVQRYFTAGLFAGTLNATREIRMDLSSLVPEAGKPYGLIVIGTDGDNSTFNQQTYRLMNQFNTNYIASAGDTAEDVVAGLKAAFDSFSSANKWNANVISMSVSGAVMTFTSAVSTVNDRLFVTLADQVMNFELDARANMQSRYAVHAHHAGFKTPGSRPIYHGCYVEDTPGHAMVHHGCAADFFNNAMYDFVGCGMVSESANETGAWVRNCAMKSRGDNGGSGLEPKTLEGSQGLLGDTFRFGYGFGMRGRAMRVNGNVAVSCTWGYVFFHRSNNNAIERLTVPLNLQRSAIDLGQLRAGFRDGKDHFSFVDYPIIHFDGNEAISCIGGMFVSKGAPQQQHDVNVHLKNFRSWGYYSVGAMVEYIGNYLLEDFDCIRGNTAFNTRGILVGGNTYQIALLRPRTEGNANGIEFSGSSDAQGGHEKMNNANDPRYVIVGHDSVNDSNGFGGSVPGNAVVNTDISDVTRVIPDPQNDAIDLFADPSDTWPLQLSYSDLDNPANSVPATNETGTKSDNLAAASPMLPKSWGNEYGIELNVGVFGYWFGASTYLGNPVLWYTTIYSDRVTARPNKVAKYSGMNRLGWFNNGTTITYGSSPITANDVAIAVAKDRNQVSNIPALSNATGSAGTIVIDTGDFIAPSYGEVSFNGAELTYTPDKDYEGTDFMYVFVTSQHRYKTVRVNFLVGPGGPVSVPIVDSDFSAVGGSGSITVTLNDKPATGGRKIKWVQYSTDGGVTWRRLCNGWIKASHTITKASDGASLTAGAYSIRLRYMTDFEWSYSGASGEDSVTVA